MTPTLFASLSGYFSKFEVNTDNENTIFIHTDKGNMDALKAWLNQFPKEALSVKTITVNASQLNELTKWILDNGFDYDFEESKSSSETTVTYFFPWFWKVDQETIEWGSETIEDGFNPEKHYAKKFKEVFKKGFRRDETWELFAPYLEEIKDPNERESIFNRLLKYPMADLDDDIKTVDKLKESIMQERENFSVTKEYKNSKDFKKIEVVLSEDDSFEDNEISKIIEAPTLVIPSKQQEEIKVEFKKSEEEQQELKQI